jgi:hypothetical protein
LFGNTLSLKSFDIRRTSAAVWLRTREAPVT